MDNKEAKEAMAKYRAACLDVEKAVDTAIETALSIGSTKEKTLRNFAGVFKHLHHDSLPTYEELQEQKMVSFRKIKAVIGPDLLRQITPFVIECQTFAALQESGQYRDRLQRQFEEEVAMANALDGSE